MPEKVEFSSRYRTVVEANRRTYERHAESYLKEVRCVVDEREQELIRSDIARAVEHLGDLGRRPRALDACGGGGNAAIKLREAGCDVTLVDITPELISAYERKCEQAGYPADSVCAEIGSFFAETDRTFDLIIFSSALHHLEDPVLVLTLAQKRLSPTGVVVTLFDRISQPRWVRAIREPYRMLTRAARHPGLLFTRAFPILKRIAGLDPSKQEGREIVLTEENVGYIAEFHGGRGFNDIALAAKIEESAGLRVVHHDRYIGNCGRLEAVALRLTKTPNTFRFLLQNAAPPNDA